MQGGCSIGFPILYIHKPTCEPLSILLTVSETVGSSVPVSKYSANCKQVVFFPEKTRSTL